MLESKMGMLFLHQVPCICGKRCTLDLEPDETMGTLNDPLLGSRKRYFYCGRCGCGRHVDLLVSAEPDGLGQHRKEGGT